MKKSTVIRLGITAAIFVIVALVSVASVNEYKKLVRLQRSVDSRWSDVAKQYQQRTLLVPNIVQVLSPEASFDKATLTELTQAQEKVDAIKLDPNQAPADPAEFQQYVQAQKTLTKALSHILMATLKNPALMTNKSLRTLQADVLESANRLVIVQSRFDQAVESYNNATIHKFPAAFEATVLGFKPRPSFQAQGTAVAIQSQSL